MHRKTDPDNTNYEDDRIENMRLVSLHHKWLKELFIVIRGNGDVTKGIEWKVAQNTDTIAFFKRAFWVVIPIALSGAVSAIVLLWKELLGRL
jgi:hypothetical protein